MDNVNNILGMSDLMNSMTIDNNKNPKNIEKDIIQDNLDCDLINKDDSMNYDPVSEYNDILNNLLNGTSDIRTISDNNTLDINNDNNVNNINNDNNDIDQLLNLSDNKFSDKSFLNIVPEIKENNKDSISDSLFNDKNIDIKIKLLNKISSLSKKLKIEGDNLENVPFVDHNSDLDTIQYVAKLLILKSNDKTYTMVGETIIISVFDALEMICNGKNEFLGCKPDLTDYTDTVKVKLHTLRDETTTVVEEIMENYKITPATKIFISLITGMFSHSKYRKRQSENSMIDDMIDIRNG